MPSPAELRAELWTKLTELPKPVALGDVSAKAKEVLPAREAAEFEKWFQQHETYLLGRLNG